MVTVNFIKNIYKEFPKLILLTTILLFLVGMLDAASVITLAPVVDLLVNPDMQKVSGVTQYIIKIMSTLGITVTLINMLIIFFLFNLIKSLTYTFSRYYIFKTTYVLLKSLILGSFKDFFSAHWYFFTSSKQGVIINTLMHEIGIVANAFRHMGNFFAKIIQALLFIIVPLCISWQITLVCLGCSFFLAVPFIMAGKYSYGLGKLNTATANKMNATIQESLVAAKVILGFSNQKQTFKAIGKAFDAHQQVTVKSQTLLVGIPQIYAPFGILVLMAALFAGRYFGNPFSEIIIILYSFYKIIPLIGEFTADKNSMDNFFPSYEQVMRIRQHARQLKQKTGSQLFTGLQHEILIEEVAFAYPDNKQILSNICARIPRGRMIAFVGSSGAGKSTFIDLIMGFHEPTAGQIKIDNINLQEFDINSFRQHIGYVPQESILFNDSIRNNLLWANQNANDDELLEACRLAGASEFIEQFPNKYDTEVGDRGVRLSGGQIQRIALARAILRKPDMLILDEATSSLDTHSEQLIQDAIEKIAQNTTLLVIAHRLSTIIKADHIYVLEQGRIVEEGTFSQLIKKQGVFRQMAKLQLLVD